MNYSFHYDDERHLYTVDGIPIPSLTQMLQADGLVDYSHVDAGMLEHKRDLGSRVHARTWEADCGMDVEAAPDDESPYLDAWRKAVRLAGWKWDSGEMPSLGCVEGFLYGFTCDRIGRDREGNKIVVEIKTSYSPHGWHRTQTALQVLGLGIEAKRFIVYLDKRGKSKIVPCTDEADYDEARRIVFEHALPEEAICRQLQTAS